MGVVELLFVAVGLSMDAFAVSVCKGLGMRKMNFGFAVKLAGFFGFFQAFMPLVGWLLGTRFQSCIVNFDHWIAFSLLAFIGGKMIKDSFGENGREVVLGEKTDFKEIIMLSVATSIDALAVGVTLAFLNINIILSMSIIGITTFVISFFGVAAGSKFGSRFENRAELFGGIILIVIGFKILMEHLSEGKYFVI